MVTFMLTDNTPQHSVEAIDKNLMLFYSYEEFTNSPLVFWEYIKRQTQYDTIWLVRTQEMQKKLLDARILCCIDDTETADEYFKKAKFIILDGRTTFMRQPSKHQIIVECIACMHFMNDVFVNPKYIFFNPHVRNYYIQKGANLSIATASSHFTRINSAAVFSWDVAKIYVTGIPRTDAIFSEDAKSILYSVIPELSQYKHLILYSPCAKYNGIAQISEGCYTRNIFNLIDFDLVEFEQFLLSNNIGIVFKMHPFDERFNKSKNTQPPIPKNCFFLDTNSLFGKTFHHVFRAFSCMISDSSSVAYEFLLLNRPIIFLHNEIDIMISNYSKGFIIDEDSIIFPGRKAFTFFQLIHAIGEAIESPELFCEERERTRKILHTYNDGKNCERLLQVIEEYNFNDITVQSHANNLALNYNKLLSEYNIVTDKINAILSSRKYRVLQKITKILCPQFSRRRIFFSKLIRFLKRR